MMHCFTRVLCLLYTFPSTVFAEHVFLRSPMSPYQSFRQMPFELSHKEEVVGGIPITVFGLEELHPYAHNVAVLWLLHGRGADRQELRSFAHASIKTWNERQKQAGAPPRKLGLLAISFDQRNHGPRETDPRATKAWAQGNPNHAQDMIAIYRKLRGLHAAQRNFSSKKFAQWCRAG